MKISVITPSHDSRWLYKTWRSLVGQTYGDFEWVVCPNGTEAESVATIAASIGDSRIRIVPIHNAIGVGAIKRAAFFAGIGDILVELDHDDLLLPNALKRLYETAASHSDAGFFYSDHADFEADADGQGLPPTYMTNMRSSWEENGFQFYKQQFDEPRPGMYTCVRAFKPSAQALSLIFWAPNHVRAWRRSVYHEIGGHDPTFHVCDDHDLMVRTYLHTRMHHIEEPLYLYRVSGANTWAANTDRIRELTYTVRDKYQERLVLRQAELAGLPAYDLGGAFGSPPGWTTVDLHDAQVTADLMQRWPWPDNSVGAFRAYDFLEHLPDKQHTMAEIHRCLAPGGWLLSATPSTDGRGAFQDPTHVSYWNQNAFWYWTRKQQAQFIRNTSVRFQEARLFTHMPTLWHAENNIPYVVADLIALKDGYTGPGIKQI